jgi:hypothetical protein
VGLRAGLDTVVKRKIPSPRWESNQSLFIYLFGARQIFTTMRIQVVVFHVMTRVVIWLDTNVLDGHAASMFRT